MSANLTNFEIAWVVEDVWLIRRDMADTLARAGWKVLELPSGEAAAAQLAKGSRVDLVVTDIRLGGPVSGWDVAEQCRAAHPAVAIIYCSGNAEDASRCLSGSIFISKPVEPLVLLEAATRLSGRPRSR